MVDIIKIDTSTLILKGVSIADGAKVQQIMDICHSAKHMYKDGYQQGRKTRKANKKRTKKWANSPGICFTYLITDDTEGHNLAIRVLVSDITNLRKKYTDREIEYYTQMYIQDIANQILSTID